MHATSTPVRSATDTAAVTSLLDVDRGIEQFVVSDVDLELDVPVVGSDDDPGTRFARCSDGNGTLTYLFFSEDDEELARAKAICRRCGLREGCLDGAVARVEPYGVWGGKLVLEGVPVEVKRKRGRPRKNPLPILVVDEAPIPEHLVA